MLVHIHDEDGMNYRPDPGTLAGLLVVLAVAIAMFLFTLGMRAQGAWVNVAQEWEPYRLNDSQRAWFKSIKAPSGILCCDISDGHPTDMERREDGIYIPDPVHLEEPRQWIKVPDKAIVKGATNPVGVATVWFVREGPDEIYIRCFVPESET
jgi:hypothetical protein